MYNGSHSRPKQTKNYSRKPILLVVSLILIVALAVGGTLAYFNVNTIAPVVNEFKPGSISVTPEEVFNNNIKSSVKILNTGESAAYIRVNLVVNRLNKDGVIDMSKPNELVGNIDSYIKTTDWHKEGNFYYCRSVVAAHGETPELLSKEIKLRDEANDAYYQVVIMAQAVQAGGTFNGKTAPMHAWGVDIWNY